MNNPHTSCIINKEQIPTLTFSKVDVLVDKTRKRLRSYSLNRAAQLGNLLKNKVDIYFKDKEDKLMRVQTTIWAVTSNDVVLKQGVTIPKSSIVYID